MRLVTRQLFLTGCNWWCGWFVGDLAGGVGVGVCGCGWGWSGMMGGLFAAVCGPSPVRGRGW